MALRTLASSALSNLGLRALAAPAASLYAQRLFASGAWQLTASPHASRIWFSHCLSTLAVTLYLTLGALKTHLAPTHSGRWLQVRQVPRVGQGGRRPRHRRHLRSRAGALRHVFVVLLPILQHAHAVISLDPSVSDALHAADSTSYAPD